MAEIKINTILGGISPAQNFASETQYNAGIGIDPDMPTTDSEIKASGYIRPTAMEKFSSTTITDVPYWIINTPKDANTYIYAKDGKIHTVGSGITIGADAGTITSSSGNGAEYYDNYLYLAKNTDISRYGPLNGTPSITQAYWGTTLGLTALTNTTYPSLRGIPIPNHPMKRNPNTNKLYIADVNSANQGVIHSIRTSKTTVEGDTNNGSSASVVTFPYGYYPTCMEIFGTDLIVGLIEGVNTTIKQSNASIAFWDTTTTTGYQKIIQVGFADPLITAIKNVNGTLYVWSGNASGGCRVSKYIGGYSFQEVFYDAESLPPFQGAVDSDMNRCIWGGFTTYPIAASGVYSHGSKISALGGGTHMVLKTTSAGANPMVTALKYVEHASGSKKRPIVCWKDDTTQGADKLSTTYGTSVWRSQVFKVGKKFKVERVRFPLGQAITTNMTITPKVYVDNFSSSETGATINTTNYTGKRHIKQDYTISGENDFCIELTWSGSALVTVGLPIIITLTTSES